MEETKATNLPQKILKCGIISWILFLVLWAVGAAQYD